MIERYRNAEATYLAGGNEADFRAVTQELLDMMAAKESEAT
jgi:hypothetical protein